MSEPLSNIDINELLKYIALNITEIGLWRTKIDRLKEKIEEQKITEDDLIYSDVYDFLRTAKDEVMPLSRTYSINNKKLKITLMHRHKGETIYGIDLIYEIIDEKIALLQYKKSHNNRVNINITQLDKIKDLCYVKCIAKRYKKDDWFREKFHIVTFCPCYYFIYIEPEEERILPLCLVDAVLKTKEKERKSANIDEFYRGISQSTFSEAFSKCWIGAIYNQKQDVDKMMGRLFSDEHLLIHCEET